MTEIVEKKVPNNLPKILKSGFSTIKNVKNSTRTVIEYDSKLNIANVPITTVICKLT